MLSEGEDAMLPVFKAEDDKIELTGLGVFKDFQLVHIFNVRDNKNSIFKTKPFRQSDILTFECNPSETSEP